MNPISGNAKKTGIPKIIETTLDTGLFDFEIEQTKYVGHACELAVKAKDNGYDAVVAVGGDGTVMMWQKLSRIQKRLLASFRVVPATGWPGI